MGKLYLESVESLVPVEGIMNTHRHINALTRKAFL